MKHIILPSHPIGGPDAFAARVLFHDLVSYRQSFDEVEPIEVQARLDECKRGQIPAVFLPMAGSRMYWDAQREYWVLSGYAQDGDDVYRFLPALFPDMLIVARRQIALGLLDEAAAITWHRIPSIQHVLSYTSLRIALWRIAYSMKPLFA